MLRCRSDCQLVNHPAQVLEACGDADGRGNRCSPELHVLLHYHPAGIVATLQNSEESRKIDRALSNDGENFLFNRLIESKFLAARLFQHLRVYVFDMHKAEDVTILFSFDDRVASAVNAMTGVKTQAYVGR